MNIRLISAVSVRSSCLGFVLLMGLLTADVSGQDATKLMSLINRDDADGVKLILEAKPNLIRAKLPKRTHAPLFWAIRNKKVNSVRVLLNLNAPMQTTDRQKQSALHSAIASRDAAIIKMVLNKSDDVDPRDRNEATPLMYAIIFEPNGRLEIIDRLLAKGAELEAVNSNGQTALHVACYYGRIDTGRRLLSRGANINTIDKQQMTPFLAACAKDVRLAQMLMDHGSDVKAVNKRGETSLHLACHANRHKIVELLLPRFENVDILDNRAQTPLELAVVRGNIDTTKLLLHRGADPNRRELGQAGVLPSGVEAKSIVTTPIQRGQTDLLKALIDGGAAVNGTDKKGDAPLHIAAGAGGANQRFNGPGNRVESGGSPQPFGKCIQLLLTAQADPNTKNKAGETPIQIAARREFFVAVELLVDVSDSLEFDVGNGQLIHWAAENGLTKTVERLLKSIENPNGKLDELEQTPLHLAAANGHTKIVKSLLESGSPMGDKDIDGMTPMMLASAAGHAEVVQTLISSGFHLDSDASGQTAVHLAAWIGATDVIEILARTSDVAGLKTSTGYTPQHAASWQGHVDVVSQLLLAGADSNAVDSDGWTPLHKAAFRGHVEVVKVLLDRGADKSLQTNAGLTALAMAEGNKKAEVVKLLK